jgi:hypothetical protein
MLPWQIIDGSDPFRSDSFKYHKLAASCLIMDDVIVAVNEIRILDVPSGTVGGRMGST